MKLKEYIAKITRVITDHTAEGDVLETISQGDDRNREGKVKDEYTAAIGFVKKALAENKELLGVFAEPAPKDELMEKEIAQRDLENHVLKVRHDLRTHATDIREDQSSGDQRETCDRIIFRILEDLSKAMGDLKLGGVFSKTEKEMFKSRFKGHADQREAIPGSKIMMPPPPKKIKAVRVTPLRPPQIPPPRREKPALTSDFSRLADPPQVKGSQQDGIPPLTLLTPSEPPIMTAGKLEEMTRRAIEAREEARLRGLSPEDRIRIAEIEARLRAEGKIQ